MLSDWTEKGEGLGTFGVPKKVLRVACFLEDEIATSAALRFSGVAIIAVIDAWRKTESVREKLGRLGSFIIDL